jgi:diguanylate cyclase (GGDEF)-like protein
MVDLDQFKAINDQHGHQAGDEVLRKVTRIIVSSLRDHDAVARYGGDEFILVIERISQEELERLSQRIRDRVAEFPVKTRAGDIPVSVSIGTTLCKPGRTSSPEELIELADQALLGAKHRRYATPKAAAPRRA